MSDRQPATDKGTADRVEADNGGYWVRLVTKQAMKREGVCMGNCLDSQGYGQGLAGEEEMVADGFWSLRKADGVSHFLIEVENYPKLGKAGVKTGRGPNNNQPSGWCVRQLRHLVAAFSEARCILRIPVTIALTGEDKRTWRPDKAPQDLKDAFEARRKADSAGDPDWQDTWAQSVRVHLNGYMEASPIARAAMEHLRRNIVGDGPIIPASDVGDEAPECSDGQVLYRAGPDEPFRVLAGPERNDAISAAMRRGIITGHEITLPSGGSIVETVTVRLGGRPAHYATRNEDGTFKLFLGDLVFPKVMPSGDIGFGTGDVDTMTFRIAPAATRLVRRARLTPVGDPAHPPGMISTDLSAKIRMTPMRFKALTDAFALLHGDGPSPGGGADGSLMREPEQVRDDRYRHFAREYMQRRLGPSYDRSDAPELACLRSACEAGITSPEAIEGHGVDWSRRSAGQQRATFEIEIARIEWALASGIGSLPAGMTKLRRLYRELERLGGPPVRPVRLVRSDSPGISPAA